MRHMAKLLFHLILTAAALPATVAMAQSRPFWMGMSDEELSAEPFVGITSDGKVDTPEFEIDTSGIDVGEVARAASSFVRSLDSDQRQRTLRKLDDREWRKWSNIDTYGREGVRLADMSRTQADAAWALLKATLSSEGLAEIRSVMHLNLVEGELLNDTARMNDEQYFFTVMGSPENDERWGFQLDGHHLVLNIVVDGRRLTMTPAFYGSEPAIAPAGTTYAGEAALQVKQDAGLALVLVEYMPSRT